MDKSIKQIFIVSGVLIAGVIIYGIATKKIVFSTASQAITQDEKNNLFSTAVGYRGGAAPSPQVAQASQAAALAANAKIDELGLRNEFNQYVTSQQLNYAV